MSAGLASVVSSIDKVSVKTDIPDFRPGDTVRVHARIVEGAKERVQVFQGVVIRRRRGSQPSATFTVRKVSYNVGVERTFLLHSPRIEKIEIVNRGVVRRAKLLYLRSIRGKATRIKTKLFADLLGDAEPAAQEESPAQPAPQSPESPA